MRQFWCTTVIIPQMPWRMTGSLCTVHSGLGKLHEDGPVSCYATCATDCDAPSYNRRYRPVARQPQMVDTGMSHVGFAAPSGRRTHNWMDHDHELREWPTSNPARDVAERQLIARTVGAGHVVCGTATRTHTDGAGPRAGGRAGGDSRGPLQSMTEAEAALRAAGVPVETLACVGTRGVGRDLTQRSTSRRVGRTNRGYAIERAG
jgi:hypothetical protein